MRLQRFHLLAVVCLLGSTLNERPVAQVPLRQKLGQMVMVTITGDSLEDRTASMDTARADLANGFVGGLVMFTWSSNLRNPAQIAHLTSELQRHAQTPLFIAIDQEGGKVARLSASNGFAATPTAYEMGTVRNSEQYTRSTAATMAQWFSQTGLSVDLAPVVDVNVNPSSPAIGAMGRSFSAKPESVSAHASWFIDEFHKRGIITALKHFPGHGSATADSHEGFTDITATWSPVELQPYTQLAGVTDIIMTAHVFNRNLDSVYPATLSHSTITGLLRGQLGYDGVVFSDAMSMKAISTLYGFEQAIELAVNAGVDMLLYTSNLDSSGGSLARKIVNHLEACCQDGRISLSRIDQSYARLMSLKARYLAGVAQIASAVLPQEITLGNYPNPFNPTTTINYQLSTINHMRLAVYDVLGREISVLVNERKTAGRYEVTWDASGMASGVYIARMTSGSSVQSRRMLLVK